MFNTYAITYLTTRGVERVAIARAATEADAELALLQERPRAAILRMEVTA